MDLKLNGLAKLKYDFIVKILILFSVIMVGYYNKAEKIDSKAGRNYKPKTVSIQSIAFKKS